MNDLNKTFTQIETLKSEIQMKQDILLFSAREFSLQERNDIQKMIDFETKWLNELSESTMY